MKTLVLCLLALLSPALSYKILLISTIPSRSHGTLAKGIVQSLLDAGHEVLGFQVTWASPYTDWKPQKNLKIIDVSETVALIPKHQGPWAKQIQDINVVKQFARNITTATVNNKQLRETLTREQFDAVVTEWFFDDTPAGFAAIQKVPWIMMAGMVMMPSFEVLVHDALSASTVPIPFNNLPDPMGFWDRIVNVATFVGMQIGDAMEMSSTTARYESYFAPLAAARGVDLPPFAEVKYNLSILFVNSHTSVAPAMSLPPNVIDIAGYHIDEALPLPQDIQTIMDASKCIVYFSMGSVLKSAELPLDLRKDLITIFEELPCIVLWKFEEELPGLKNIVVRKWWPQSSLLGHPKVRLFITHGGMLSTTEAVHKGVPLLAIPVFGDQPSNAARAARAGFARAITYSDNFAPELKVAVHEMLKNDSYYTRAKFLSHIFNKRPVHPRKLISSYIELAIESKGAYHLRSRSFLYAWYERFMLDAIALVLVILASIYLFLRRVLCSTRQEKKEKKVKRK